MLDFEDYFYFAKFIGNTVFGDKNDKCQKSSRWINFNISYTCETDIINMRYTYASCSNLISNLHNASNISY